MVLQRQHQPAFTGVDGRLLLEPGSIALLVGRSSADIVSRAEVGLVGEATILRRRERFFSEVHIE